jgi:hypothetical protein
VIRGFGLTFRLSDTVLLKMRPATLIVISLPPLRAVFISDNPSTRPSFVKKPRVNSVTNRTSRSTVGNAYVMKKRTVSAVFPTAPVVANIVRAVLFVTVFAVKPVFDTMCVSTLRVPKYKSFGKVPVMLPTILRAPVAMFLFAPRAPIAMFLFAFLVADIIAALLSMSNITEYTSIA